MKATKYFLVAATALTLGACSNDNEPMADGDPVAAKVYAGIGAVQSRAAGTEWANGDQIGIYGINQFAEYRNIPYVTNDAGNSFTPVSDGIFFQTTDDVRFHAYYPYTNDVSFERIYADTRYQDRQEKFDFMYTPKVTANRANPVIRFTGENAFRHCMSRLILNITSSVDDGFNVTDVFTGDYFISGLSHVGSLDIRGGATRIAGDIVQDWKITAPSVDTDRTRTYSMILFPQDFGEGMEFKAVISGQSYTCTLPENLAAGYSYTYNITVKKTGIEVSDCTIKDWEAGNGIGEDIDATMPTE